MPLLLTDFCADIYKNNITDICYNLCARIQTHAQALGNDNSLNIKYDSDFSQSRKNIFYSYTGSITTYCKSLCTDVDGICEYPQHYRYSFLEFLANVIYAVALGFAIAGYIFYLEENRQKLDKLSNRLGVILGAVIPLFAAGKLKYDELNHPEPGYGNLSGGDIFMNMIITANVSLTAAAAGSLLGLLAAESCTAISSAIGLLAAKSCTAISSAKCEPVNCNNFLTYFKGCCTRRNNQEVQQSQVIELVDLEMENSSGRISSRPYVTAHVSPDIKV